MPILEILGKRVQVGDEFNSLTPEQQQQTVNEIAASFSQQSQPSQPQQQRRITAEAFANLPANVQQKMQEQGYQVGGQGGQHLEFGEDPNDRGSLLDPLVQGTTFGWADEMRGHVQGALANLQGGDGELVKQLEEARARHRLDNFREDHPLQAFGAEIAGSIPTAIAGGGALAGKGATLLARAVTGGAVGAGQGAIYGAGAADENKQAGAAIGGGFGAGVGAVAPYIGNWFAQKMNNSATRKVLNQAAQNLDDSATLKGMASTMFNEVDNSGAQVSANRYFQMLSEIDGYFAKHMADQDLDAGAMRALERLMQAGDDMARSGNGIALGKLHNLRQIAQSVMGNSSGRNRMFAGHIVSKIDDMAGSLKPMDIIGGKGNEGNTLMRAIGTWHQAKNLHAIEEAIRKARNQASGFENGLRVQFGKLLNNPRLKFSPEQRRAIEEVVQGTAGANIMRLLGGFGIPTDQARSFVGSVISGGVGGALGGLPGSMLTLGAGTVARKQASNLSHQAAKRALTLMTDNAIPLPPPPPVAIPTPLEQLTRGAAVPLAGQIPVY